MKVMPIDLISTRVMQDKELWNLYTIKEEYNPTFLDLFGRFPYYLSKNRNILEPRISKFLIDNGFKVEFPKNQKFAVCLNHDIDLVYFTKLNIVYNAAKLLKKYQMKSAISALFYNMKKKWNPWWNFEHIMALEEKYGAKSSFYFLVLDKEEQDFNFKIEELRYELRNIADNGWEVCLHGGHTTYKYLDEIKKKKKKLERISNDKVIGYRNHFLKFSVPETWELLSKAGFKYDTTLGYSDCVGFKNGMCHPFKPFNLNTNKEIEILEIPLIIMDTALLDHMRINLTTAWEITKQLINTVEKYNGVITILWHNTSMVGENLNFYEKILKLCRKKEAWMTSGKEIWKWWSSAESSE